MTVLLAVVVTPYRGAAQTSNPPSNALYLDWETRNKPCFASVTSPTRVTYVLTGPNLLLYEYSLLVESYTVPTVDLPGAPTAPPPRLEERAQCDSAVLTRASETGQSIQKKVRDAPALNPLHVDHADDKKRRRISLLESIAAWEKIADRTQFATDYAALEQQNCTGNAWAKIQALQTEFSDLSEKLNRAAEKHFTVEVQPDKDYQYTLLEKSLGRTTPGGKHVWRCADDALTLSAGVLATAIADRSYANQRVAVSGTPNVQERLVVSGDSSVRPVGLALFNFKLPWRLTPFGTGLTVSSGPVLRFGGQTEISSLGYFAGASVHLWRGFFLTPVCMSVSLRTSPPVFSRG